MSSRATPKVAVLMGGPSAEREVSLSTGRECAAALRVAGYEVTELDAGADLAERLADARPDVAFNALHASDKMGDIRLFNLFQNSCHLWLFID